MKHLERQPRLTKPFIRLVDKVTGRGDTSLLTREDRKQLRFNNKQLKQEAKVELKAYTERLDRAMEEEIARVRSDPKSPPIFEDFLAYVIEHERLEREARARGEPNPLRVAPLLPPVAPYSAAIPIDSEQRQLRNNLFARELDNQLISEVIDTQFDQAAQLTKERVWKGGYGTSIAPSGHVDITIKDDGTVVNRSLHGVALSYTYTDGAKKIREELSFGIGYFGDRSQIVPEAQGSVTNEELERGVKAYFVEITHMEKGEKGTPRKTTKRYVIPFAYAESQKEAIERILESAKNLAPEQVIPLRRGWKRRSDSTLPAAA